MKNGDGGDVARRVPLHAVVYRNAGIASKGQGMAPADDVSMNREIAVLNTKVDMILESIRRSEEKSDVSRASVHRRMDELVERVGKVETSVVTVQDDVKKMKPTVDDVRRWKLIGLGALGVIGFGGMAMGVTFADAIRRLGTVVLGR
ncbi:DUF1515 family protein [Rhizobium phaseoli]|uniref:DUF1515 family protein n=1 Tax=Rhizobium phaseoli TaxID=396 RepID=UPI00315A9380